VNQRAAVCAPGPVDDLPDAVFVRKPSAYCSLAVLFFARVVVATLDRRIER